MKKQIILLISILIITTGFLSGCNQNNSDTKIDISKVVIVNYTVEIREDFTGEEYREIIGFVKNNAGKKIDMINIEVMFYDIGNNYIYSKNEIVRNLANKETRQFDTVYHSLTENYYKVDWSNIKFQISEI